MPAHETTSDTDDTATPVLKIGAVVLRVVASKAESRVENRESSGKYTNSRGDESTNAYSPPERESNRPYDSVGGELRGESPYDILIIQPIPKQAGELPPFVLPRGSRQYRAANGAWHDVRDAVTGIAQRKALEPFSRALAREVEEEAGITADMLARAYVVELGAMAFASRSKGTYPIHWFRVMLDERDADALTQALPVDALAVRWATLEEIQAMAATGAFSPGYVPVIEAALQTRQTSP